MAKANSALETKIETHKYGDKIASTKKTRGGEFTWSKDRCTGCIRCAKRCPVDAIVVDRQKDIAKKIIDRKADYILALKANQKNLQDEVIDLFEKIQTPEFEHYTYQRDTQIEKDHGRIEKRECITINDLSWLFEIHKCVYYQ